jgi:hypothetical protein
VRSPKTVPPALLNVVEGAPVEMGGTVGGRRKESCVKRPSGVPAPYAAGVPETSASSFREERTVVIGKRICRSS